MHVKADALCKAHTITCGLVSDRRKVWLGYQQSLRPCESGLTLNVDLAATAFLQVQVWPWPSWALLRPKS